MFTGSFLTSGPRQTVNKCLSGKRLVENNMHVQNRFETPPDAFFTDSKIIESHNIVADFILSTNTHLKTLQLETSIM